MERNLLTMIKVISQQERIDSYLEALKGNNDKDKYYALGMLRRRYSPEQEQQINDWLTQNEVDVDCQGITYYSGRGAKHYIFKTEMALRYVSLLLSRRLYSKINEYLIKDTKFENYTITRKIIFRFYAQTEQWEKLFDLVLRYTLYDQIKQLSKKDKFKFKYYVTALNKEKIEKYKRLVEKLKLLPEYSDSDFHSTLAYAITSAKSALKLNKIESIISRLE